MPNKDVAAEGETAEASEVVGLRWELAQTQERIAAKEAELERERGRVLAITLSQKGGWGSVEQQEEDVRPDRVKGTAGRDGEVPPIGYNNTIGSVGALRSLSGSDGRFFV